MKNISTIVNNTAAARLFWALTMLFSFNTSQLKGIYKFVSRLYNRMAVLPLTLRLCLVLVLGVGNVWGQTIVNQNLRGGSLPTGWSQTSVTFTTAASGYARFQSTGSILTTPVFNASANTSVTVSFNVAKWGSGTNGPITVEYSTDGGSSWITQGNSSTPTSSTYLPNTITIPTASATMLVRFTRGSSPSQKRLRDVVITGIGSAPPPSTPTITLSANTITNLNYNLNYGPATNQTFTTQGANLTANINLSAPPNFEISTSSTTGFTSSLTLTPTAGTVNPTTIYTRLAANLGVGIYTGTLSATSSGAPAQNISLNGKVLPTLTSIGVAYTEDFSSYSSAATVPSGWSIVSSSGGVNGYGGNWGTGTSVGQRGAGVLGYQHTSSSGVVTKTLTLLNDIGTTIDQLEISYDGKVERATQGRSPEYTVTVNGTTISELAYSTASGVDESIIFTVTGLNILNGETVEIRWSSDRGLPSGSSRQIGIDDVSVMVANNTALPVELSTFSGVYNKHFSVLNWETESEQNNDYFTLYHSTNGKSFEQIGRVSGSGNTSSLLSYTFEHREPRPGINYYKLTSTDYDGTIHDKGIIALQVEMNHVFYDQITQSIQMNYTSDYAIYGSDGRLIARVANQNVIPFSGHGVFHVIDERSGKTFKLGVW